MAAGAAFKSDEWIYTIDSVKFTVDGAEYPVASLAFSCQHNGIPGVKIGLAANTAGNDVTVQSVDLVDLVKFQNTLQSKVNSPDVVVTLDAVLKCEKDTQTISLKKWVLQGAGIEDLGVGGKVMVSALIMHPACKARQSNLVVYSYPQNVEQPSELIGDNIYQWYLYSVEQFLLKVSEATTVVQIASNQSVAQAMAAKTTEALEALKENVKWQVMGEQAYPLQYKDTDLGLKSCMQTTIWNMSKIEGGNPFDGLMNIMGTCQLCLMGSFSDEPLQIVTFEPWGAITAQIYDDEINMINMPPEDPQPISGVTMKFAGSGIEFSMLPPGYYVNLDGHEIASTDYSGITGDNDLITKLIGELVSIDPPLWLMNYMAGLTAAGQTAYDMEHMNDEGDVENPTDAAAVIDWTNANNTFRQMAELYGTQYFWSMYRAGVQISMVTRFMLMNPLFKTPGSIVTPGLNLAMSSRAAGEQKLMYFFCDRVQHFISADAGQAYSQITGSFVRPADGVYSKGGVVISADDVAKGKPNVLWTDTSAQ